MHRIGEIFYIGRFKMEKELYKRYENDIKNVFLKSLKRSELSLDELDLVEVIRKTEIYLEIYDNTEGTDLLKIFIELFLTSINRRKTIIALAMDLGYSKRTVIRFKKKILRIFAFIKDKSNQR